MATAEQPGRPASAAASGLRSGSGPRAGSRSSPLKTEEKKCSVCAEGQPGGSPPGRHPACPLSLAHRQPGSDERLPRRTEPERSSSRPGRRDGDGRRELFVSPALVPKVSDVLSAAGGKHKPEEREELRRRNGRDEELGVLSDSENEEPISRRIRNISAFIRKTKSCASFASGSRRSQSCTDPVEDRAGKLKVVPQPGLLDRVGISHSFTAGILLSSENSRSVSAPITAPDRRFSWRAVVLASSSGPLVLAPPRPERSISPESNDSISEELNHFKPIVCSPCTPPKRLPDGRLVEPTIVKSTPRNLTRGLQKATSYEASPAVLQKWRQIELDRQSLKVNSKATLTSPVGELQHRAAPEDGGGGGGGRTLQAPAGRDGDGAAVVNKRRLLFDPPDADVFQKQTVKIRVPAIRYSGEAAFRADGPESCSGGALFGRKQSFSPYSKNLGFQSCRLVPKDSQSPRKESDSGPHNQTTSRRGQKREQKTKHLDSDRDQDLKRSRSAGQAQQERQDRALALKLQRQFDLENQTLSRSPNSYFLRSWMTNQSRRRRGLRRSRRINKKL
ncbi:uncharacterized protein V6R79_000222 [Siganus canaliculatus]